MKRLTAILLATIYLSFASGIVINTHYCMGEIAGVGIGKLESNSCGYCGMKNDGCCHDEVKIVKISSDQSAGYQSPDVPKYIVSASHDFLLPTEPATFTLANTWDYSGRPPPDNGDPSICIRYCVFRI